MTRTEITNEHVSASGAVRYDLEVDLSNTNTSQTQLVLLCGEGKDVLEVGPATGYVTKVLAERGCRVTAIEIDPVAAEQAAAHCQRMIVGDIEQIDLAEALGGARFDVVLFGDVLEHLVDPLRTLTETRAILAPGGCVVASIPNIAHGSVRIALLTGRFSYTETGLLDRTHLRFYDRSGVQSLFEDAGYQIREWRRVVLDLFETEVDVPTSLPPHLVESVERAPEATTYQFIVLADPIAADPRRARGVVPADVESDLAPLWDLERSAEALSSRVPELEAECDQLRAELAAKTERYDEVADAYERATSTRGYRALQRMYALLNKLAPDGTRRRKTAILLSRPFVRLISGKAAGRDNGAIDSY